MTFPKLTINTRRDGGDGEREASNGPARTSREERGCYLTDGVHLYRAVDTFHEPAAGGLIGLEDCSSLDIVLVVPEALSELRVVEPAAC